MLYKASYFINAILFFPPCGYRFNFEFRGFLWFDLKPLVFYRSAPGIKPKGFVKFN